MEGLVKQPFALKFRPQQFKDVVGNSFVTKTLQISALNHDIANAYFLSGTRGSGKTSLARIFAKAINCEAQLPDGEPCLKCSSCLSIDNQNNFDVVEVDGAYANSVENMRHITESLHYAAVQAKFKTIIIDECHSLTTQAANSLLKTLEAPPENTVFILCTTEPDKVIDTIRSRCLVFRFKTISIQEITLRLRFICDQENISIDDSALEFIARYSKGGLRDAIQFIDQLSRHKVHIDIPFLYKAFSIVNEKDIFDLIQLIIDEKEQEAVTKAINLIFDKTLLDFISVFIEVLERIYLFKLGLLQPQEIDIASYKLFASELSRKRILQFIQIFKSVTYQAKYFFLLSHQASIVFLISSLFDISKDEQKVMIPVSFTNISNKVQAVQDVLSEAIDITDNKELLNSLNLKVEHGRDL